MKKNGAMKQKSVVGGPWFGITLPGLEVATPLTFDAVARAALRLQDETGMNAVEIWMDRTSFAPCNFWPEEYDRKTVRKVRNFLAHFDYAGVHLPFAVTDYISSNPVVAGAARNQILRGIAAAGAIGARYAVGHARYKNERVSEDENFKRYAEASRAFADAAGDNGLVYCVETCEFLDTPEKMLRLYRMIDHPSCRLTLDAGKFMVYSDGYAKMLAWLDRHAGTIGSTHLWDYEKWPGRGIRILPGNGLCDMRPVVEKLVRNGYRGSYNLETSGNYSAEKTAVQTLKRYLDQALTRRTT